MDVAVVQWPRESERRAALAVALAPRLLLVEAGDPPAIEDCLEDWVRVPATEEDMKARMAALSVRARRHVPSHPTLDRDGLLRYGGRWVSLPPVEARLTEVLLRRFGSVVTREGLVKAAWPQGATSRNALDVQVVRLRRRLQPLGLRIRTVRSRGYVLEGSAS